MTTVNAYCYVWSRTDLSDYKCPDLTTALANGVTSVTMAFVIADPTNPNLIWSEVTDYIPEMASYIAKGNDLWISCGGASGTYIESVQTQAQMVANLSSLLQQTGCRQLDFDIENGTLGDMTINTKRALAIAQLQQMFPGLKVRFTIATEYVSQWQNAIPDTEWALIQNAITNGVSITQIGPMVMDCSLPDGDWGTSAVTMLNNILGQMKTYFPSKTQSELNSMLFPIFMIGKNDNGTTFTLADAQTVTNYAIQNRIGGLSYWALQRDQSSTGGLAVSSMIPQTDYQFYNIFKQAATANPVVTPVTPVTPVVVPVVPVVPVPVTPITPVTPIVVVPVTPVTPVVAPVVPVTPVVAPQSGGSWAIGVNYTVGSVVTYNGHSYKCQIPNTSIDGWQPSNVPALWIDLGPTTVQPVTNPGNTISVPMPTVTNNPSKITMTVTVTYNSGVPTISVQNTQISY